MSDITAPLALSPIENVINVSWGNFVWFFPVNVAGATQPIEQECVCCCPSQDGPPLCDTISAGGGDFTFSQGKLYRSEDAFNWTEIPLPNMDAGITQIRILGGEMFIGGAMAACLGVIGFANCDLNFGVAPPNIVGIPCSCSGCLPNLGGSCISSKDRGRSFSFIAGSGSYGPVNIVDMGPVDATDPSQGENVQIAFGRDWDGSIIDPTNVVGLGTDLASPGVGSGVQVRIGGGDAGSIYLETSTDGGNTWTTTLTVSTTEGYLHAGQPFQF